MPGQDKTGPLGQGPLTGRGLGLCGRGIGFRRRLGMGFDRGVGQSVQFTKDQEKKILKSELEEIRTEMQEVEKRLKELKSTK